MFGMVGESSSTATLSYPSKNTKPSEAGLGGFEKAL